MQARATQRGSTHARAARQHAARTAQHAPRTLHVAWMLVRGAGCATRALAGGAVCSNCLCRAPPRHHQATAPSSTLAPPPPLAADAAAAAAAATAAATTAGASAGTDSQRERERESARERDRQTDRERERERARERERETGAGGKAVEGQACFPVELCRAAMAYAMLRALVARRMVSPAPPLSWVRTCRVPSCYRSLVAWWAER